MANREKMITLETPDDTELLAAVGKVALRSSLLDLVMKMTIVIITGMSVDDALCATARTPSRELRKRVRKLAKDRLGEGRALIELEAILSQAEKAIEDRNSLIHSDWVHDEDGKPIVQDPLKGHRPVPTVEELEELAAQIRQIYLRLNTSRLKGSLKKALDKKSKKG